MRFFVRIEEDGEEHEVKDINALNHEMYNAWEEAPDPMFLLTQQDDRITLTIYLDCQNAFKVWKPRIDYQSPFSRHDP